MGTKSTVAGGCTVGEQSFIGINSTVFDDTHVGRKCIVGACSAVKRNLPDYHACKTRLESMQVKAYAPEVIESKLLFRENVRTPLDINAESLYTRPTTNDQRPTLIFALRPEISALHSLPVQGFFVHKYTPHTSARGCENLSYSMSSHSPVCRTAHSCRGQVSASML